MSDHPYPLRDLLWGVCRRMCCVFKAWRVIATALARELFGEGGYACYYLIEDRFGQRSKKTRVKGVLVIGIR